MNCVFTQEQHDAAVEWLEKHREELGLAKERNAERRADARRLHEETDGFGYFPGSERRMKKFSDVSDSEDDADVDDLDESELDRERRRVNDEFKEVRPHRASRSIDVNLFQPPPPPSLTRRARLASRTEPRRNSRRSSRLS
jgi:hypothetical protein